MVSLLHVSTPDPRVCARTCTLMLVESPSDPGREVLIGDTVSLMRIGIAFALCCSKGNDVG